ncbi:Leucine rich repeat-containing protein [Ruminococcus flavefaciens]|uniref:Leucine rich repeat-containing protein n=2 Tax=Ruminococcus flavefaciens TaxID=1265 RepID=A0A1M7LIK2_RUMFL|nr:Leucine rich repeat-containing protein [Ruminococcus flavefaciens]
MYLSEIELGENVSEIGRGAFGCTSIDVLELSEKVEFIDNIFSDMHTSTKNEIYKITNTVIIKNPECEIETRSGEWGDVLIVCDENSAAMENAKKSNARCCTPEQYEKGEYDKVEVSPLDIFVCIKKYGMMFKETEDGLEVGKICCVKNGTVVIPDEVGGIPVVKYDYGVKATREGSDIFISIEDRIIEQYIDEIEKVVIGKNVKLLGPGAFTQCKNIKSVEGGEGLEKIGDQAFFELHKLEKFDFSDKLKEIESYAFYGCCNLTDVKLNNALEKIGANSFSECVSLDNIIIPDKVSTIGEAVFNDTHISTLVLPESVKNIGRDAFSCFSGDYKDRNEKVLVSVTKVDRVELKVLNPECEIDGDPFYKNSKDVYMYGYADSTAWNFAHKNQVLDFYAFGDANNDYQVDMSDIVLIMQSLANPNKYGLEGTDEHHITQKGIDCADVDNAGNGFTANDALKIQKYLLGQEKLV